MEESYFACHACTLLLATVIGTFAISAPARSPYWLYEELTRLGQWKETLVVHPLGGGQPDLPTYLGKIAHQLGGAQPRPTYLPGQNSSPHTYLPW